jgi:hypothetical protein
MKTTAANTETYFATAANAPAPEFTPCPLRDTLAVLFSVAGLGILVKVVLFTLTLVAGY